MYDLRIDSTKLTDSDMLDRQNGFLSVTDAKSAVYLNGASIDWVTEPDGTAGFKFDNPNAAERP